MSLVNYILFGGDDDDIVTPVVPSSNKKMIIIIGIVVVIIAIVSFILFSSSSAPVTSNPTAVPPVTVAPDAAAAITAAPAAAAAITAAPVTAAPTVAAPAIPFATTAPGPVTSQIKCGANKFCLGMINDRAYCYGDNAGCKWNTNDCATDADCAKYNASSPKFTDNVPCSSFKPGDWPYGACVMNTPQTSWDFVSSKGEQTKNYDQMKEICTAKGQRLCKSTELCSAVPGGTPNSMLNQFGIGDNWIAISDAANEWLTYATFDSRVCKTHTQVAGAVPGWGTDNINHGFARAAKCCNP